MALWYIVIAITRTTQPNSSNLVILLFHLANSIYATQTPHILHFHSALSYIVIAVARPTQPNSSNSVHHFAFSLGQLTQLNLIYGGVKNENCK